MSRVNTTNFSLMAISILTLLAVGSFPVPSLAQVSSVSNVKKEKRSPEEQKAYESTLPIGGKYQTPNLRDVKDNIAARSGRPAPLGPLYRRFPLQQVVVGEAGDSVLTYDVLHRMVTARLLTEATFNGLKPDPSDEIGVREWERLQIKAEAELLQEWALIKTLAYEAKRMGLNVSPQEVEQKLAELSQERLGDKASKDIANYNKAVGVEQNELQEQIKDGILIDKYILLEVERNFNNEKLLAIYNRNPAKYITMPKVHAWQILRKIDPSIRKGSKEYADMREKFYEVAKKAAKSKGKNFPELAREYSDNPMNKETGGDMGWISATDSLAPEIMAELAKLKIGEVSKIIETKSGFHILRVTEYQPAKGVTFDESARKKVIDECVFAYKKEMAGKILSTASVRPRMNPNGFRLITEPRGSTHDKPNLVNPRPDVAETGDNSAQSNGRSKPILQNPNNSNSTGNGNRPNLGTNIQDLRTQAGPSRSKETPAPSVTSQQPSGVAATTAATDLTPSPTPARRNNSSSRRLYSRSTNAPVRATPTPGLGVPVNY